MIVNFTINKINTDYLFDDSNQKKVLIYADFNMLNLIYESKLELNDSDINIYPDSTAVYFALKIFNRKNIKKIISTDLQENILYHFVSKNKRVFFFGDTEDVLLHLKNNLIKKYENILISGTNNGFNYNDEEIIKKINNTSTEILFVGLGAGRQEKWIINNHKKLNCKLILSCGGWFQYLAGYKKRAPIFIRRLHLEWLHKLINEFPRVWKRYFLGIPLFYYRLLTKKIILKLDS